VIIHTVLGYTFFLFFQNYSIGVILVRLYKILTLVSLVGSLPNSSVPKAGMYSKLNRFKFEENLLSKIY